ncbi:hypothetical protein SE23_07030 [Vibrio sinaloensis]|uniref:hypothetical protein n=1 Tax=Photobacterium sp. (strain ATCC 43367) TaxID=379097 RepID=UPI000580018B|nr:hypothetical protein [Vibrio sinaloensis]KIE21954.1 hypothetical protein SE23_07030 [Vibrio sinaloensis]
MKVCWKKNKNLKPSVILAKIDSIKNLVDGKVSFSGFEYHDAITALESMINFPPIAEDLDKHSLVKRTVWEVAKSPKIDRNDFINELDLNINKSIAKRDNRYFVLTSLSIANFGVRKIEFQSCTIRFYKNNFPRKFKGRKELILRKQPYVDVESLGYTKVVVEITTKSEILAANMALRTLDLLRGLFSIFSNNSSELYGNKWEPINKIRLGKFHTVHDDSGNVFDQTFWLDPSFIQAKPHHVNNEKAVAKSLRAIIGKLSKFDKQYHSSLCDALLRYVRAYDEANQNVAVLRAWGALECIAAPNESNCDAVPVRCSFLFDEHEYHRQILEHLREYRNRNVHAGQESTTAKSYGFQVQRYFITLFLFHVSQQGNFTSIDEANRFLDLPPKEASLLNLKSLIDRSLKFRGYVA